jgi:hypothetical protein
MSAIVLQRPIDTAGAAEALHRLANRLYESGYMVSEAAGRAVRARDPIMLATLEAQATMVSRIAEEQHGHTRRLSTAKWKPEPTMVQSWKEAYATADRGQPNNAFFPYYTAVAIWCGFIPMPYGV